MSAILDIFLTLVHLILIFFNLFGWIHPATRKLHFISICLTAFSWLILGLWFGIGYCPITDWQWDIKVQLGERNLPSSFITYMVMKISGRQFSDQFINVITAMSFIAAAALSVYYNFLKGKRTKKVE